MFKSEQLNQAETFSLLHRTGTPLILVNIWDPISASIVEAAGATAIATSSHALAQAYGYKDGENISIKEVARIAKRIADTCALPLTLDIESGYGCSPSNVEDSVSLILEAGAVGVNIEDGRLDGSRTLRSIEEQQERISAARRAGERSGISLFVNARIDTYLLLKNNAVDNVKETLLRAKAYLDAGANGIFVPGLADPWIINSLSKELAAPLNILLSPRTPSVSELTMLGVARISLGGMPFEFYRSSFSNAVRDFYATYHTTPFLSLTR